MNRQIPAKPGEGIALTLIKFSLPLILSGVLQQLYNWADAFIVGNVEGELALAAIGATTTVINFFLMAVTGFTLGLAILFGQKFGAGESGEIPKMLSTFAVALGGVFTVVAALGFVLAPALLRLLQTPAEAMALSQSYLRIIFAGVPFLAVYNVYAAALRGMGDSRAPFLAVLVSSVVNVSLDLLLVALLRKGVGGAAMATVVSQAAMTVFLISYAAKKYPALRFRLDRSAVDGAVLRRGLRFGTPPMLQSSVNALGSLLLQRFMNGFGALTVAAITTAYRVDSIVLLPIINLGAGISTLVAQSVGAGDKRRAGRIFAVGSGLMAVVSLVLTAFVIPAGGALIAMFGVGAQATAIGRDFFRQIAAFYLVFGMATAVRGYLEGQGDLLFSSVVGVLSLGCRILLSYTLGGYLGTAIIAYAEAVAWALLLLLYAARACARHKKAPAQQQDVT